MPRRIPVAEPALDGRELQYVTEAVESGWVSSAGPFVQAFEAAFAEAVEARFATSTSNETAALHLALLALGIGPGDEVIVPALSFVASANVVAYTGARPVFVDVDPVTWTMDPAAVAAQVTPRTKAIMPVHLYGHPADLEPIQRLARARGLALIEDAAEALGARYQGRPVGALGTIGAFSFYGNKIVTTGEGGMVVTNDPDLLERINLLKNHGMDPERRYWHPVIGFNYRMTNLQAALGLAQLEQLDQFRACKRAIADRYRSRLAGLPGVHPPGEMARAESVYWLYTILVDPAEAGLDRDQLAACLGEGLIDTRPTFVPLPELPPFEAPADSYPVAARIGRQGLSLPSGVRLSEDEIDRIADAIRCAVNGRQMVDRGPWTVVE